MAISFSGCCSTLVPIDARNKSDVRMVVTAAAAAARSSSKLESVFA